MIQALRDAMTAAMPDSAAIAGLVIGFAFGALTQRATFCAMGAMSDVVTFGDSRRLRSWMLAAGIAIVGLSLLAATGTTDPHRSMYAGPRLAWGSHLFGGLLFGIGMVLAGGCASRNLVRAGAGDLRSAITLVVVGIFAYITSGGLLGPARAALDDAASLALDASGRTLDGLALSYTAATDAAMAPLSGPLIGLIVICACLSSRRFRASPLHVVAGIGVGLLVTAGWAATGLAFDELGERVQPVTSLSFVKPTGDALEWVQRFTALGVPGFGVASVIGVFLGAATVAIAGRSFRLATFADTADTVRHLAGGALMGIGGVMALGCSIGQGVTGLSTLALGSFVSLGAIMLGAVVALKAMARWV